MMLGEDGATQSTNSQTDFRLTTRVAFLRAVNVGKRRVANTRLIEIVKALGGAEVWTHINSGNVVCDLEGSRGAVEGELESEFEKEFGFEVTTFVRTPAEVRHAVNLKPFTMSAGDTYFVTFLKSPPSASRRADLEALSNDFDTLVVDRADVHWRMHGKSSDTKLPTRAWEKILGPRRSTSRNVTMLSKLVEKIEAQRRSTS
jgi:uncharacterized protein (DUF1697 family)